MENKSFNFDLQLFTEYTLTNVDWNTKNDGKGIQLKWGQANNGSGLTLADAVEGITFTSADTLTFSMTSTTALGASVDLGGATIKLSGSVAQDFFYASTTSVIKHAVIESTGTAETMQNVIATKNGNGFTLTVEDVTFNLTGGNQGSVFGGEGSGGAASITMISSSVNIGTNSTGNLIYAEPNSVGYFSLDSKTTITSANSQTNSRLGFLGSNTAVSSAATIIDKRTATSGGSFSFAKGSTFTMTGGSFDNTGAGSTAITDENANGSVSGTRTADAASSQFVVQAGTLTLKASSTFITSAGVKYTVNSVDSATSAATLTVASSTSSADTVQSTTGIFSATSDKAFSINGVSFAAKKTVNVAGKDWYYSGTYGDSMGGDQENKVFYFTALPEKVTSDTPNLYVQSGTTKMDSTAVKVSGVASDATVTFASAVETGAVKILATKTDVKKIVNGTDTLVAGSFEIGSDGTLVFGADLSSEESSDDSTDTSDESTDTSDESTDTSDESTDTSDESTDTSDESTDTSDESSDTSDESGDTSDESGETSDESGETSDESGETSDESGETSDESGETSDESGETSDESGETSDESGETSDESGETSDDSSSDTSSDTSTDTEDEDAKDAEDFINSLAEGADEVSELGQGEDFTPTTGKSADVSANGAGTQNIKFSDKGGSIARIGAAATGKKNVTFGAGGDYAIIGNTSAAVNVAVGGGDDFIVNKGTNTTVDFANAGTSAPKVMLSEGSKATFNNYDGMNTNAGIAVGQYSGLSALFDSLATNILGLLSRFNLSNAPGVTNDVLDDVSTGTDENYADAKSAFVNLYYGSSYSDSVKMALTGEGASYIDTNESEKLADKPIVAVGNYSGNKGGTASIRTGSGNDAIFAGDGDTVDAGTGSNNIYLSNNQVSADGTTIIMSNGSYMVEGTFDNDVIVSDAMIDNVASNGTNVAFVNKDSGLITVAGANNSAFNVKAAGVDYLAKVGSTRVDYEDGVNYYKASNTSASIVAGSSNSSAEIWLNKDVARTYGYDTEVIGDIKYINAAAVSGKTTLAGSADINNVITAGSGASSVWGGGASDDTLVAGAGTDTFFYMKGDGNDSIKGAGSNDVVRLEGGLTLADIASIDTSKASSLAIEFTDGGSLTLNTNNGTKFKIDGATYSYDRTAGEWQKS